jgi:hypothetical protein
MTVHDATWGLGEAAWAADQEAGTITFTTERMVATAPMQIIGTYSLASETWMWGWDHPSVKPHVARHARAVRSSARRMVSSRR